MKLHTRVVLTSGATFQLPHDEYKKILRRTQTSFVQPAMYEAENLFGDKIAFDISQVMSVQEVSKTGLESAKKFSDEIQEIFGDEHHSWE